MMLLQHQQLVPVYQTEESQTQSRRQHEVAQVRNDAAGEGKAISDEAKYIRT